MSRAGGPGLSRFCDEPAPMTSDNSPLDVVQMGKGRKLVLLHSLLSDRTAFDCIAPRLAPARRVWLVNLPGFGASAPAGPGLEQMADRIAEQLPKLGLAGDADLLGNGFGGLVSVGLAVRPRGGSRPAV